MPETDPLLQPCPNCATLVDISDEEPFARAHCPICGIAMRVRTRFNNFQLEEILGMGGVGSVYRARDLNLERPVALKLLRAEYSRDREYIEKFEREARITASVNHPHVVKVFAFGLDHGLVYMAMELVDKGSLDDLIALQTRVAESQVLEVGIQVAQGLQAAHAKGLIHRDVKPGNILFADAHTAKITDFGLAILMEHDAEACGEVWGTPYYVAPEKLNKDPEDFRSDIYSLGGTLFHALAGRPPFEAETASLVALMHIKSHVVSLQAFAPNVSGATAYVINRMLKQNPNERYQSYDDLVEHLRYAQAKARDTETSASRRARVVVRSQAQERLMTWVTLGTLLVLILGGLAVFLMRDSIFEGDREAVMAVDQELIQAEKSLERYRDQYDRARGKMVSGSYDAASEDFRNLAEIDGVPQPLANWVLYHYGLNELIRGNEDFSRQLFARLAKQGNFSDEPIDRPLGKFFVESATRLADNKPVAESALDGLDLSGADAIGALGYGLKNWALGDPESAVVFLKKFDTAKPSGPFAWIEAYRILGRSHLADYAIYSHAVEIARQVRTLSEKAAALEMLREAGRKLKTGGAIGEDLEALESHLVKEVEKLRAEEAAKSTARVEADRAIMEKLKPAFERALKLQDYGAALKLVELAAVESAEFKEEHDAMILKARWLSEFKRWLLWKIPQIGYTGRFIKRNGGLVPGEVRMATPTAVAVSSPYGATMVHWMDVSPQTVLAMAMEFLNRAPDAGDVPDRYWQAGVFAFSEGLPRPGKALLLKASESKADYADELAVFFEWEEAR